MKKHTTSCPECQKEHAFPDEYVGKKAKCHCGTTFILEIPKVSPEETVSEQSAVVETEASPTPMSPQAEDIILKPDAKSYFMFSYVVLFFVGLVVTISSFFASAVMGIVISVLFAFAAYAIYVAYNKERYILKDRKIVREYGTIFSDNSLEVQMERVTIVLCKRPWILKLLFGTGHITLKAAGSSGSKMKLIHIKDPMSVYETLQMALKRNGFHLEKKRLVQTARPHMLGIFGELGGRFMGTIFGLVYFSIVLSAETGTQDIAGYSDIMSGVIGAVQYSVGALVVIITLIYVTLAYMDLRRRRYHIYEDAVEYTEGFLTRHDSIIPMENVSDVENTQGFFSKIFGLHDIKVSCQGAGNDVTFKNMTHGEKMIENLKYLKDAIIPKEKPKAAANGSTESLIGYTDKIDTPLKYDESFTGEYRMNKIRALAPYIILLIPPLTPFGIVIIIGQLIRAVFTTYMVTPSSIEKRFHFLSNKHTSYSIEKITGITVRESLIDKVFKTCSINFLSIGSSGDMTFSHLKKVPDLEKNLCEKVGIYVEGEKTRIETHFSFIEYLKANIGNTIGALVFIIFILVCVAFLSLFGDMDTEMLAVVGLIVAMTVGFPLSFFIPIFIYKKILYSARFYKNFAFDDGVFSKKGIIFQKKEYALYRNVKGITSTKYPLTSTGKLVMNVSGEKFVQQGKKKQLGGKKSGIMVSNTISIPYTTHVQDAHLSFDGLLGQEKVDTTKLLSANQDIGNSIALLSVFLLLVVLFGFAADYRVGLFLGFISILILGLTIWSIKVKYYDLETSRVLAGSGIIYKKRQSILYNKFNFIELNRGFWNKIFRNGSVSIFTLGSGKKEMSIKDTDAYQEIYNKLQID